MAKFAENSGVECLAHRGSGLAYMMIVQMIPNGLITDELRRVCGR